MKILFVQTRLDSFGGGETYFHGLLSEMKRRHEVAVASFDQRADYHLKEPALRAISSRSGSFMVYRQMKTAIRSFSPQVIHIATNDKYPLSILMACMGHPTVFTSHTYSPVCYTMYGHYGGFSKRCGCERGIGLRCIRCISPLKLLLVYPLKKAEYLLSRKAIDIMLSPSRRLRKLLEEKGLSRPVYVPHFVTIVPGKSMKKTHDLLFAGRLYGYKGIFHLVRAMGIVVRRRPKTRILVAGEGPDGKKMKDLVTKLGIADSIDFIGKVAHEDMGMLYPSARITLVPSLLAEQFGLVGIESMACGTPCIAYDSGGIREWLDDGVNGRLVRKKTPEALAQAILSTIDDASAMARYREGCRATAKRFSKENHIAILEKTYERAVMMKKKGRRWP